MSAIAVTGATGGVGSRVIDHLLARADRLRVVALARRPDAVPAAVRVWLAVMSMPRSAGEPRQ